jgi:hypothetical protein
MSNFDSDGETKEARNDDREPLIISSVPDYTKGSKGKLNGITQNIDKVAQKLQSIFKPRYLFQSFVHEFQVVVMSKMKMINRINLSQPKL